jgi:hypothetical protein
MMGNEAAKCAIQNIIRKSKYLRKSSKKLAIQKT